MATLDDLTTPLTVDEIRTSIYDAIAAVGGTTTTWKPGAWPRTVITGASIVLAGFSKLTSLVARGGFRGLATGPWLDLVARYVYNVLREQEKFAAGEVTLTNASGFLYELDPGDLTVKNPTTGKTYKNSAAISLGPSSSVVAAITAEEAGSASTSAAGTITELVTPFNGVTCTNAAAVVGQDTEDDATLNTKCDEKLGALSPMGPPDAYAYAARTAKRADGTLIGVTRVTTKPDGKGNLTVYVATATGAVTGDPDDPDTDLGAVNDALQKLAGPLAVTVFTESAETVAVPVIYELWLYNTTGFTDEEIEDAIEASLIKFMSVTPIGGDKLEEFFEGRVFHTGLEGAISSTRRPTDAVAPLPVIRVSLTTPAGDTVLAENQVPVPGTITPTIHQVAKRPGGFA